MPTTANNARSSPRPLIAGSSAGASSHAASTFSLYTSHASLHDTNIRPRPVTEKLSRDIFYRKLIFPVLDFFFSFFLFGVKKLWEFFDVDSTGLFIYVHDRLSNRCYDKHQTRAYKVCVCIYRQRERERERERGWGYLLCCQRWNAWLSVSRKPDDDPEFLSLPSISIIFHPIFWILKHP